jgi:hypothetical protein
MASPTVRSRQLARTLRELRKSRDIKQAVVARHLNHTVQWVVSVEKPATCRPSVGDVRALLALYGVTDQTTIERVVDLAREAKRPGWWHNYELSEKHATFIGLEAEAETELTWEKALIPGLLQTEAYARAIIASGPDRLQADRIDELTRVRIERQKVLCRPVPLRLHAIIGEGVLRWTVGGPAVMRAQLQHLCEAAEAPNITVQAVPFTAGAHPGMTGSLTILRYPATADPDVLYCDTAAGAVYSEDSSALDRAHRVFSHLAAISLSPRATIGLAARYAAEL